MPLSSDRGFVRMTVYNFPQMPLNSRLFCKVIHAGRRKTVRNDRAIHKREISFDLFVDKKEKDPHVRRTYGKQKDTFL